ncbi:MAG: ankyrin repeat domain-containing protein [Legionella sp.]|nr:ankyrin repeat domain-containing protein [Legionella sp.]
MRNILISSLLLDYVCGFDVKVGAEINYQNDKGYTALMFALDMQNDRIAEYLLTSGANPLLKNRHNKTARSLVSRNSQICQILKGYELLLATMEGNLSAMKALLITDNNIIDFQGNKGYTPLLIAVELGFIKVIRYLLTLNPNLEITCEDGRGVFELVNNNLIKSLLLQVSQPTEDYSLTDSEDDSRSYNGEIDSEEKTPESLGFFT